MIYGLRTDVTLTLAGGAGAKTLAFDAGPDPKFIAVVCAGLGDFGPAQTYTISSVTYGSTTLTEEVSAHYQYVGFSRYGGSYIHVATGSIPSGSNTLTVNLAGGSPPNGSFVAVYAGSAYGDVAVTDKDTESGVVVLTNLPLDSGSLAGMAISSSLEGSVDGNQPANMTQDIVVSGGLASEVHACHETVTTTTGSRSTSPTVNPGYQIGVLLTDSLDDDPRARTRVSMRDVDWPLYAVDDDPGYDDEDDREGTARAAADARRGTANAAFQSVPEWAEEADTTYVLDEDQGVAVEGWRGVADANGEIAYHSSTADAAETGFAPEMRFILESPGDAADDIYLEQWVVVPRSVNAAHHFFADFTTFENPDSGAVVYLSVAFADNELGDNLGSVSETTSTSAGVLEVNLGVPSTRTLGYARVRVGLRRESAATTVRPYAYLTDTGSTMGMIALPLKGGTYGTSSGAPYWTGSSSAYPLGRTLVTATTDPLTTDDLGAGYPVGTRWLNTATSEYFTSTDATDDAAVWLRERSSGRWELLVADGVSAPPDPLTNEDEDDFLYGWTAD